MAQPSFCFSCEHGLYKEVVGPFKAPMKGYGDVVVPDVLSLRCESCGDEVLTPESSAKVDLFMETRKAWLRPKRPLWTVLGNLNTANTSWVGHFCEFFDDEDSAQACYDRHVAAGDCPCKRPYYHRGDWDRLHILDKQRDPLRPT